jgi:hypothetical protein
LRHAIASCLLVRKKPTEMVSFFRVTFCFERSSMNPCFPAERSAEAVPRQTSVSEFSETGLESYLTISRYHISTDSA